MSTLASIRTHVVLVAAITCAATSVPSGPVHAGDGISNSMASNTSVEPPNQPPETSSSDTNSERFTLEHRRELYRQSRLSPWAAAGWTMLLPGLGNLYAEQYLLAGLGFTSFTFSGSFLAYGIAVEEPVLQAIGWSFAGIAYGGGMTTSIIGVHRYNRHRRQSLGLEDKMVERHQKLFPQHGNPPSPIILNLNFRF